jgi:hypothetical protein
LDDWGLGLLGHLDFFERFRVFVDYSGGSFNIETKKSPNGSADFVG